MARSQLLNTKISTKRAKNLLFGLKVQKSVVSDTLSIVYSYAHPKEHKYGRPSSLSFGGTAVKTTFGLYIVLK